MPYKYQIQTPDKEAFLRDIQKHFAAHSHAIHEARNTIKIIPYQGTSYVVKSFKIPHLLNRFVYSYFKDSKAKKSYENSLKISDFVPAPLGYIEFYHARLIKESFFISEHFDYDFTIREVLLDDAFTDLEKILQAFADFTFHLHEKGIYHKDYSPGNILIKKEKDVYLFKIVDINRMEFHPLSLDQRLKNFAKLWAKDTMLKTITTHYAKLIHEDAHRCYTIALQYSQQHKNKTNMKKRARGIDVVD